MDVLALVKADHLDLAGQLEALGQQDPTKNKKPLQTLCEGLLAYVSRHRDYLYPELEGLFDGSAALVELAHAHAASLGRQAEGLAKSLSRANTTRKTLEKRLEDLAQDLSRLVRFEQETLMPRIRRSMRTEEREDLGQVFLDLREEAIKVAPPGARKRA